MLTNDSIYYFPLFVKPLPYGLEIRRGLYGTRPRNERIIGPKNRNLPAVGFLLRENSRIDKGNAGVVE